MRQQFQEEEAIQLKNQSKNLIQWRKIMTEQNKEELM